MTPTLVTGSVARVIKNEDCLYHGNLVHYFQAVWNNARNVNHPYHNFRHMLHVTVMCYDACLFYKHRLTPLEVRNLLIAALFHDFDHAGIVGDDDLNIARATRGITKHALSEDRSSLPSIYRIIRATQFPYTLPSCDLPLDSQIIREADASQSLSVAWIQEVVFGLAKEQDKKPSEMLQEEIKFHSAMEFRTEWGRQKFPQSVINEKIAEVKDLLQLLDIE